MSPERAPTEPQPQSFFEQHSQAQTEVSFYGIKGTLDQLIQLCPVDPSKMAQEAKDKFAVQIFHDDGHVIAEEYAHYLEPEQQSANNQRKEEAQHKAATVEAQSVAQKSQKSQIEQTKPTPAESKISEKLSTLRAPAKDELVAAVRDQDLRQLRLAQIQQESITKPTPPEIIVEKPVVTKVSKAPEKSTTKAKSSIVKTVKQPLAKVLKKEPVVTAKVVNKITSRESLQPVPELERLKLVAANPLIIQETQTLIVETNPVQKAAKQASESQSYPLPDLLLPVLEIPAFEQLEPNEPASELLGAPFAGFDAEAESWYDEQPVHHLSETEAEPLSLEPEIALLKAEIGLRLQATAEQVDADTEERSEEAVEQDSWIEALLLARLSEISDQTPSEVLAKEASFSSEATNTPDRLLVEQTTMLIDALPQPVQEHLVELVTDKENDPRIAQKVEVLLMRIAPVASRLHELAASERLTEQEAVQITELLGEWYEQLLTHLETEVNEAIIADFIELVCSKTYGASVAKSDDPFNETLRLRRGHRLFALAPAAKAIAHAAEHTRELAVARWMVRHSAALAA